MGLLVAAWLALVGAGIVVATRYSSTPGTAAAAPTVWPDGTSLEPDRERFTLVMLAHPKCPCTRASIGELSELMQRSSNIRAYVLFVRPTGTPDGWEKSDTWTSAASIAGVRVIRDDEGAEARRFGAHVSGQTLVYDSTGRLVFEGGLTPARGHAADTTSRDRIASLVRADTHTAAPVFGCDLEDEGKETR